MNNNGAPLKPWEINRGQSPGNLGTLRSTSDTPMTESRIPPPVPARPSEASTSSYQPMYGMGGSYGGYGSSYMGMGGYGGMYGGGMYGNSYRGYGQPMNGGFTQQAEDSTRQAFQSVESIVRAFTSVSQMLESTFGAVYSSFRAVLDVADHFSRVKTTFTDILSSIAVFKLFKVIYRRALAALRLGECDDAWDSATIHPINDSKKCSPSQKKSWPIMLFAAVVIGGPYLIWRLLKGVSGQKESNLNWVNGDGDHVLARAEFDFQRQSDQEVSFKTGDTLVLAPRESQPNIKGWLIGTIDGKTTGYLPSNHVKILGLRKGRLNRPPTPQQVSVTSPTPVSGKPPQNVPNISVINEEWKNIHGGQVEKGDGIKP